MSSSLLTVDLTTDRTDLAGGTNFIVINLITLCIGGINYENRGRSIVASIYTMIWGARLSGFLLYRILKSGNDTRFDDKRQNFFKFLGFWIFQMFWVWTVSLPVTLLNSPNVSNPSDGGATCAFGRASDIIGIIMFAIGFGIEVVADQQKYLFKARSENKSKFMQRGLWAWSRHPNYFGEILLWFGIFTLTIAPSAYGYNSGRASQAQYASILGPFFLVVLLFAISGLPLQERPGAKKRFEKQDCWEEYCDYLQRTSIFFPIPPKLYRHVPVFIKRSILLEFPCYVFNPQKHGSRRMSEENV